MPNQKLTEEEWKEILRDYEFGRTGIAFENVQRVLTHIAILEDEKTKLKSDRAALVDVVKPFAMAYYMHQHPKGAISCQSHLSVLVTSCAKAAKVLEGLEK